MRFMRTLPIRQLERLSCLICRLSLFVLLPVLSAATGYGQVAVTEVMSNAIASPEGGDDFWELTNFGEEAVDLTHYWFRDRGGFDSAKRLGELWDTTAWGSPVINPGESVLFVRFRTNVIETVDEFRRWWGIDRLNPRLKINFYHGYGLDSSRDTLNLWKVSDDATNLVQRLELFKSPEGRSLTYDPLTGVLGPFSFPELGGAFFAATTEDVGSPGVTSGRTPIRVVASPQDTSVDAGSSCAFTVNVSGMPPPNIQWLFEGEPIPDAHGESLELSGVIPGMAGRYSAELDNGLERIMTPPANLIVNDRPSCARIVQPPKDVSIVEYHTAVFRVETRGYPLPTFRWEFQGRELVGETASTLYVESVDETRVGKYTVFVSNALCTTNVSMELRLKSTPRFQFTEAMVLPTDKFKLRHDTWWELTNVGTNTESLLGYRWDDHPRSLTNAPIVDVDVRLAPGESAIFVAGVSPANFRQWWGEDNLPENLVILTFDGNSLSPTGEAITIWDDTALREDEWLLVSPTVIGVELGKSLWYHPTLARTGLPSVEGEGSAFRAIEGGDIGSPGWSLARPRVVRPRMLEVRPEASGVRISWRSETGARYELWRSRTLAANEWVRVASLAATGESLSVLDPTPLNHSRLFYRVVRLL